MRTFQSLPLPARSSLHQETEKIISEMWLSWAFSSAEKPGNSCWMIHLYNYTFKWNKGIKKVGKPGPIGQISRWIIILFPLCPYWDSQFPNPWIMEFLLALLDLGCGLLHLAIGRKFGSRTRALQCKVGKVWSMRYLYDYKSNAKWCILMDSA